MAMCVHSQEYETCSFGCTFRSAEDLRLENDVLRAENTKLREALDRIETWADAYPISVFPKPDLKKAAQVLEGAGMTLDSISADNMRHVLEGITDIVTEALKD